MVRICRCTKLSLQPVERRPSRLQRMCQARIQRFTHARTAWEARDDTVYAGRGRLSPLADVVQLHASVHQQEPLPRQPALWARTVFQQLSGRVPHALPILEALNVRLLRSIARSSSTPVMTRGPGCGTHAKALPWLVGCLARPRPLQSPKLVFSSDLGVAPRLTLIGM
jgi:hypothetical protein